MKEKKYYITKQETDKLWNFVGDPINPFSTMDAGLIEATREEMRVDQFGLYITRFIE